MPERLGVCSGGPEMCKELRSLLEIIMVKGILCRREREKADLDGY